MAVQTGGKSQLGGLKGGKFRLSYQPRILFGSDEERPMRNPLRIGRATKPAAGRYSAIEDMREDIFLVFSVLPRELSFTI